MDVTTRSTEQRANSHLIRLGWVVALVSGLSAAPSLAQTQTGQPGSTSSAPESAPTGVRELRAQLGGSINNLGVQQSFDLSWRRALSASRRPMLSGAHVALGGSTAFTPAHVRGGVWVDVAPVSILVVRVGVEPARYFGTFDSLTSFDSRRDAFDTDSRRERGGATSGTATRLYVTPTFQFRAGRFVGATSADLEWWSSDAAGPFFYEPTRDTLLDVNGDRVTTLTSAVLHEHPLASGGQFSAGLMHSLMRVDRESLNEVQKVGVVATRRFDGRVLGLARPSVTAIVSRYLDDPSKRGEWSGALSIGFSLHRK
jgi:hypothetical protein